MLRIVLAILLLFLGTLACNPVEEDAERPISRQLDSSLEQNAGVAGES